MTVKTGLGKLLLATGAMLWLLGKLSSSDWGLMVGMLGAGFFAAGAVILASLAIIEVVPWSLRLGWRKSEPVWNGEILHTDGGEYKIRYDFDEHGSPRFVAADVCTAIGMEPPDKEALRCNRVLLAREGPYVYFLEDGVQSYLAPIAVKNRAANRLLVLIRTSILRKMEKSRGDKKPPAQVLPG